MDFILWLLGQLPKPVGITLALVGVWAGGIKLFAEKPWRTVVRSKLFIFPSLIGIYTVILSVILIGYTQNRLVTHKGDNTHLTEKWSSQIIELTVFEEETLELNLMILKKMRQDASSKLYENLDLQAEYRKNEEPVPKFLFDEQAMLKGQTEHYNALIPGVKKKLLGSRKRDPR